MSESVLHTKANGWHDKLSLDNHSSGAFIWEKTKTYELMKVVADFGLQIGVFSHLDE